MKFSLIFGVTNCDYKLSFLLQLQFTLNGDVGKRNAAVALVDAEVVLFVEARRVARVANDKRCSVEVHAAFFAANEQVRTLTHRCGAMDAGRAERGGTVGWAGVDLQAIVGARDTVKRLENHKIIVGNVKGETNRTIPSCVCDTR